MTEGISASIETLERSRFVNLLFKTLLLFVQEFLSLDPHFHLLIADWRMRWGWAFPLSSGSLPSWNSVFFLKLWGVLTSKLLQQHKLQWTTLAKDIPLTQTQIRVWGALCIKNQMYFSLQCNVFLKEIKLFFNCIFWECNALVYCLFISFPTHPPLTSSVSYSIPLKIIDLLYFNYYKHTHSEAERGRGNETYWVYLLLRMCMCVFSTDHWRVEGLLGLVPGEDCLSVGWAATSLNIQVLTLVSDSQVFIDKG